MHRLIPLIILFFCFSTQAKHKKHRPVDPHEPAIVHYDVSEDRVLYNKNINQTRPIASITKLMTAMVALDYSTNMNRELSLIGKVSSSLPRKTYKRGELFEAMLIRSDNAAAETLSNDYPGGRKAFIEEMNNKALRLGMPTTVFRDPTGLNNNNVSTASEVAVMVKAASSYPLILNTSIKKQTYIETKYKKKVRTIMLTNTNRAILFEFDNVIVSKTGYTTPAGFCVAIMVEQKKKKVKEQETYGIMEYFIGKPGPKDEIVVNKHIIVILGAKNPKERVDTVKEIMYNNVMDQDLEEVK
jgi:D-alanyl-D-alanine endopeptidase (penicillin-binding protein 7)